MERIEYRQDEQVSILNIGGSNVMMVNHDDGEITCFISLTEKEIDYYYEQIDKNKTETDKDNYDVKDEQGLYGYGY